ncbi:MAG: DUF2628 domain-containing protein [Rhodoblastus sp.]|nr:MAG: DUF2628 domain-containing protein [Rhodoblastus sp.]
MPIYAAHAPKGPPSLAAADRVTLVRQGFSWRAFLFGPWWLAASSLWRALIVWAITVAVVIFGAGALGAPDGAIFAALALIALYLGLEAAALRSAALDRAGRPLADILAAGDEDSARSASTRAGWLRPKPPRRNPRRRRASLQRPRRRVRLIRRRRASPCSACFPILRGATDDDPVAASRRGRRCGQPNAP